MRATGFGVILRGLVVLGFGTAFWLGTLAPALAATVLWAILEGARARVRREPVQVTRNVRGHVPVGDPVEVLTRATAEAVPLRVEDHVPAGITVTRRRTTSGYGRAEERLTIVPETIGTHRWTEATVHVQDPWATHEAAVEVTAPTVLRVHPEPEHSARGRRTGRRHTVQALVRSRRAFETVPDVESVREYRPGDRMRDIDWSRSSRLGGLHTKERVRVAPRPVLVLIEATPPMRWQRRTAKLTTAARLTAGVVAAAQTAGVSATVFAVQDDTVTPIGLPVRGDAGVRHRLEGLPVPIPVEAIPADPGPTLPLTMQDRRSLQSLALARGPRASPMDEAISRLERATTYPALLVLILDAERDPASAEATVRRLAGKGHQVVTVVPATGTHHFRRHEVDAPALVRLRAWHDNRRRLAERLQGLGVPVLSLRPDNIDDVVEEVAAWAE